MGQASVLPGVVPTGGAALLSSHRPVQGSFSNLTFSALGSASVWRVSLFQQCPLSFCVLLLWKKVLGAPSGKTESVWEGTFGHSPGRVISTTIRDAACESPGLGRALVMWPPAAVLHLGTHTRSSGQGPPKGIARVCARRKRQVVAQSAFSPNVERGLVMHLKMFEDQPVNR